MPLFNKQTPLEQGELRDAIEAFSAKAGFQLDNVFVIDGSRRSTKASAYFSGLGAKKRIVLYDTLINDLEVRFAAHHCNAATLGSALKKLSVNNLSNLTPHPAYVFFHYSHPPSYRGCVP